MSETKAAPESEVGDELEKIAEVAKSQKGYVATYQVDVSDQLFRHHEQAGRLERALRGIYRVNYFPAEEDEQLVVAYLWSKEEGTISHETALAIHDLSDVLPNKVHMTLPEDQRRIRRKQPEWLELHFADLGDDDIEWYDVVRVTRPVRTLVDVAVDQIAPEVLRQAVRDAKEKRLVGEEFEWTLIAHLQARCG